MPFAFKLSKRLARLRLLVIAAALALGLACDAASPSQIPSFSTSTGLPAAVTDLTVKAVTDTSATLTFTEVDDGTGHPAAYDVRYAAGTLSWGSAADVSRGTCALPVTGTAVGAVRSCSVLGLKAATSYAFQIVPFRGTLNVEVRLADWHNFNGQFIPKTFTRLENGDEALKLSIDAAIVQATVDDGMFLVPRT